jgi:hypothetical protein
MLELLEVEDPFAIKSIDESNMNPGISRTYRREISDDVVTVREEEEVFSERCQSELWI